MLKARPNDEIVGRTERGKHTKNNRIRLLRVLFKKKKVMSYIFRTFSLLIKTATKLCKLVTLCSLKRNETNLGVRAPHFGKSCTRL
jgi:hypothetical protein